MLALPGRTPLSVVPPTFAHLHHPVLRPLYPLPECT